MKIKNYYEYRTVDEVFNLWTSNKVYSDCLDFGEFSDFVQKLAVRIY